jgi:hypothetical protein
MDDALILTSIAYWNRVNSSGAAACGTRKKEKGAQHAEENQ